MHYRRTDICESDKNCAILGAARVGSMCDPADSAALCEDNGLRLGFVIAHEIAHTLVFTVKVVFLQWMARHDAIVLCERGKYCVRRVYCKLQGYLLRLTSAGRGWRDN